MTDEQYNNLKELLSNKGVKIRGYQQANGGLTLYSSKCVFFGETLDDLKADILRKTA